MRTKKAVRSPERQWIVAWLEEIQAEGVILADGFESAFVGISGQFSNDPVAVYDREKCIEILMTRDGMDEEGAVEHFEFNVQGAWVGQQTPTFLVRMPAATQAPARKAA